MQAYLHSWLFGLQQLVILLSLQNLRITFRKLIYFFNFGLKWTWAFCKSISLLILSRRLVFMQENYVCQGLCLGYRDRFLEGHLTFERNFFFSLIQPFVSLNEVMLRFGELNIIFSAFNALNLLYGAVFYIETLLIHLRCLSLKFKLLNSLLGW